MTMNYLVCGVGGQGVVLCSKLIAYAAMNKGLNVRTTETIGMAQRGGSVVSHVRVSDGTVHSSLIPEGKADIIISFEPAEAVRSLRYLRENGAVIVCGDAVIPVTSALSGGSYDGSEMTAYLRNTVKTLFIVDPSKVTEALGTSKPVNIFLLGCAAASGALGFTVNEMRETVEANVPEKYRALNLAAFDLGASI